MLEKVKVALDLMPKPSVTSLDEKIIRKIRRKKREIVSYCKIKPKWRIINIDVEKSFIFNSLLCIEKESRAVRKKRRISSDSRGKKQHRKQHYLIKFFPL